MKFAFNPESEIEHELIDRCITHGYIVEITKTNGAPVDFIILERIDGTMQLRVRLVNEDGEAYGQSVVMATDNIDLIYIH